jgi:uncharacterized protein DUF397
MTSPVWRKSSHSGAQQGDCVELAALPGVIGIRDSKNPEAGHLEVTGAAFGSLLNEIKAGRLAL